MDRRLLPAFLACSFALAGIILFEYGKTFTFYFVGDDFAFIEYVLTEKTQILWKASCFYHYYPLGLLLIVLPACFNIFEPAYFVAIGFIFFLACSILIMVQYRKIAGGLAGGFFAALIYATALPNSEVIYWKSCTSTIAMTCFSLLSLLFFIWYLEKKQMFFFFACIAAFIASGLCMEQGVVTFGILLLYDLIFYTTPRFRSNVAERKSIAIGFISRYTILIVIPLSLAVIKKVVGAELSPFSPSQLFYAAPGLIVQTLNRLYDFNHIFPGLSLAFWPSALGLVVIFFVYIIIKRTAAGLFFFLSSVCSILTISLIAGGPNERYFALPLTFFASFLSLFLKDLIAAIAYASRKIVVGDTRIQKLMRSALNNSGGIIYAGICISIAAVGLRGNLQRREFWASASQIERNIVGTVEDLYVTGTVRNGNGKKLYLLNVPEYMVSKENSIFYICSNSLMPDLRNRLNRTADEVELAATGNLFQMNLGEELVIYRVLGRRQLVGDERIHQLIDDGHIFFQFSPGLRTIVPLQKRGLSLSSGENS